MPWGDTIPENVLPRFLNSLAEEPRRIRIPVASGNSILLVCSESAMAVCGSERWGR
jgi:hypothetical protein